MILYNQAYGVISSFGVRFPLRAEIWILNLFVWINMSLNPVAYGAARKQYRMYYLYFIKKFIRIITFQPVHGLKGKANQQNNTSFTRSLESWYELR